MLRMFPYKIQLIASIVAEIISKSLIVPYISTKNQKKIQILFNLEMSDEELTIAS